jgi:hypothetical protein
LTSASYEGAAFSKEFSLPNAGFSGDLGFLATPSAGEGEVLVSKELGVLVPKDGVLMSH